MLSACAVAGTANASVSAHGDTTVGMSVAAVRPSDFTVSGNKAVVSTPGMYQIVVGSVSTSSDKETLYGEAQIDVQGSGKASLVCVPGAEITTMMEAGDTITPLAHVWATSSDKGNVKVKLSFSIVRVA